MVLQLLAATDKTGQLEVRAQDEEHRGFLGVSRGRLAAARFEDEDGYLALGAVFAIDQGDFEFLPQDRIEREDLSGDLEELLERAATERERIRAIREAIPNDRVRFRLSERAIDRGQITLEPAQWKALLMVDGQRDVAALAGRLEMPRLDAQKLLADLVRAGLIDTIAPAEGAAAEPARPYRRLPPMQPIPPTTAGERVVLRGRIPDFPLETIVQLLAETKKTGRLEIRSGRDASTLGMNGGQLVSATTGEEEGELGLGAAFTAQDGEFEFVPMSDGPAANLTGQLDPLLDRAAAVRDRIVAIRGLIPNERARFTLSERATRNPEIVLTPEQWRVLLGVNGERDVHAISDHLRMRRLPVMMVLADLVRGGYVDVLPAADVTWPQVERRKAPWAPATAAPVVEEPVVEEAMVVEPHIEEPVAEPEAIVEVPIVEEPIVDEPIAEIAEITEEAEPEAPFAEIPVDVEPAADDRLAALSGLFGPAEPAPPPAAWEPPPAETAPAEMSSAEAAAAQATAEAFASAPAPEAEPEIDPRLAAFGAPPAPPEAPSWEAPPSEPAVPSWETPSWETPTAAPAEPETPEVDPRLAVFESGAAPAWEAPAPERAPLYIPPGPPPALDEPVVEARAEAPPIVAPPAPAAPTEKKKGLFGGLFGGKQAAATAVPEMRAGTRAGQLATFANELVNAYNSGQYGRARVEDRMLNLIMRVDEQADPIDRPIPVVSDRLDIASIDREAFPERQALPYLAVLVRQVYDDAERALGKDKARRGFREVRDRLFGTDLTLLQDPEVSGRLPKA